jgi:hypothetical protein
MLAVESLASMDGFGFLVKDSFSSSTGIIEGFIFASLLSPTLGRTTKS